MGTLIPLAFSSLFDRSRRKTPEPIPDLPGPTEADVIASEFRLRQRETRRPIALRQSRLTVPTLVGGLM